MSRKKLTIGDVYFGVLSFIFAHRLDGIRKGTVIAALLVGFIARLFGRLFAFLPAVLFRKSTEKTVTDISTGTSNL